MYLGYRNDVIEQQSTPQFCKFVVQVVELGYSIRLMVGSINLICIYYNLALPIGTQISKIEAARKYKIVNLRNPSGHACCLFALRSLKPRLDF